VSDTPEPVLFLQIEPTTRCNFTCGFCAGRYMEQADLPYERFAAALDAFPDLQHIELQGEGESLMHPRFFDMLALARGRGVKVSLISNGSLLTPAAVGRLLDLGVEKVSVSLESADPATFQDIRGGKLEKVLRGVEALLKARDERGLERPIVGFSITVLRRTQGHLRAILDLYERLGLDGGVTMQPLQAMDAYVRHYDAALRADLLSEGDADAIWGKFFSDAQVRRIQKRRRAAAGFFDQLMDGWRPARRSCPWLDRALYVHNSGHVTACCMVKDTARHAFGRLGADAPGQIVAGRARMRDELARGVIPAPCQGCELGRFAVMTRPQLARFALRGLWQRWFGGARAGERRGGPVRLPVVGS
jgi:MoaA/NifB/PqqE/SkfB family radical SAM enzyme